MLVDRWLVCVATLLLAFGGLMTACSGGDGPGAGADPDVVDTDLQEPDTVDPLPPVDARTDADTTPPDVRPDAVPDVPGDPDVDEEVDEPGVQRCGGLAPLRWEGRRAQPGGACGPGGAGRLVCNGVDALFCEQELTVNRCGGFGALRRQPGEPCGCGGEWACGEDDDVVCVGSAVFNPCGGCNALPALPGAPCVRGSGAVGQWVCGSETSLLCVDRTLNACGGAAPLVDAGGAVVTGRPGGACRGPCGSGVFVCEDTEVLRCAPDRACNACGGAAPLAGSPGAACGPLGDGEWACDGRERVRCEDASPVDACGAPGTSALVLGAPCEGGGRWRCDGSATVCAPSAPEDENACGGQDALGVTPGTACGTCRRGVWRCIGEDSAACSLSDDEQEDGCGGCGRWGGAAGDPCGVCGGGRLTCDDGDLVCVTPGEARGRDACGACASGGHQVGGACGDCAVYTCAEGALRCVPDTSSQCLEPWVGCEDLDCSAANRLCIPPAEGLGARCGACLAGYREQAGACVQVVTCDMLNCAATGRFCVPGVDPRDDARCSSCPPGQEEVQGQCVAALEVPRAVTATAGVYEDRVLVLWDPSPGALGYHVYRDGQRVTTTPITAEVYEDFGASPAGAPGRVSGVSATQDRLEDVRVTWSSAPRGQGPSHGYRVSAVAGTRESARSVEATGHRAGVPILRYELRVDGGPWVSVGDALLYVDADAPAARILPGTVTASVDRKDGVFVERSPSSVAPGAERSYSVRAVNVRGSGEASATATGTRALGSVQATWERSSGDSDSGYSALLFALFNTHLDTNAPVGAGRYYRVRYTATGTDTVYATARRGLRLAQTCADLDCAARNRVCEAGTATQNAICAACLDGFVEVSGSCVPPLGVAANVRATQGEIANLVRITWDPVPGVDRYQVFRNGSMISGSNLTATTLDDTGAAAPPAPPAPQNLRASRDRTDGVLLTWDVQAEVQAPRYTYTVRAVRGSQIGASSEGAEGWRASHAITGYQLSVNGGTYLNISNEPPHLHNAAEGTVDIGAVAATEDRSEGVLLNVAHVRPQPGPLTRYRIRARTASATGAASDEVEGQRVTSLRGLQWLRSASTSNFNFSDIPGATSTPYLDTTAPTGSQRWYQLAVEVDGISGRRFSSTVRGLRTALQCSDLDCASDLRACVAGTTTVDATCGGCLPNYIESGGTCVLRVPGPTGLVASDATFRDRVHLSWQPLAGSEGYAVYRDGVLLEFVIPSVLELNDRSAADSPLPPAVTGVAATTDRTDGIVVTWEEIVLPPGLAHQYEVSAFVSGVETQRSSPATGRRAPSPLVRYDLTTSANSSFPSWRQLGIQTTYEVPNTPMNRFTYDTIEVSDDRYDGVQLRASGFRWTDHPSLHIAVRAVTERGNGAASAASVGQRAQVAPDTFRWTRSVSLSTSSEQIDLEGAVHPEWLATDVPTGTLLNFRFYASAPGAADFVSAPIRGAHLARLFDFCTTANLCEPGGCISNVCTYPSMLPVYPGSFLMGSPPTEPNRGTDEGQREVTLTHTFFLSQREITNSAAPTNWRAVYDTTPLTTGGCTSIGCPVGWVSWWSAIAYANAASAAEDLPACYQLPTTGCTGLATSGTLDCGLQPVGILSSTGSVYDCVGYRLPTEAEWEYAYRAGTTTMVYTGDLEPGVANCSSTRVSAIAWYCGNQSSSQPVRITGGKQANAWGFHDMAGNVREWVWDYYLAAQETLSTNNPVGPPLGTMRVTRGGMFSSTAYQVRAASRAPFAPSHRDNAQGFRLARTYHPE